MRLKKGIPAKKQTNLATNLKSPKKSPSKLKEKLINSAVEKPQRKRGRPKPQAKAYAKSKSRTVTENISTDSLNNNNEIMKIDDDESIALNNNNYDNEKSSPSTANANSNGEVIDTSSSNLVQRNGVLSYVLSKTNNKNSSPDILIELNNNKSQTDQDKAKDNRIKCKECNEWFPNRYFHRKHMLRDHEGQLYECRVCSFTSVDPDKLKTHIMKLHVAKKEKAELQEISLNAFHNELEKLIDKKEPRKVLMEDGVALGRVVTTRIPFVCDLCNRVYTSKYSLERHVRCHTLEKPFSCDICDFTTAYREHLGRHMLAIHLVIHSDAPRKKYIPEKKNSDRDSPCPRKRKPIVRQRFECAVCGMRSSLKTVLIDHIKSKHPNAHIESMNSTEGNKIHLISTAPQAVVPSKKLTITCDHCSLIFHDNWKYKVHMRSHTGFKPFSCSVCDMKATSKMSIRDHIHRKHKDVPDAKIILKAVSIDGTEEKFELPVPFREFKCEICELVFDDNYGLKNHKQKEHPETKPFSCAICQAKFLTKAAVTVHWSEVHPKKNVEDVIRKHNKPCKVGSLNIPKCVFCNKIFPYRSQLSLHLRLHSGEKMFHCDNCDYQTDSKTNLEAHMKRKHLGIAEMNDKNSKKGKSAVQAKKRPRGRPAKKPLQNDK